jgi:hypothetical protein
VDARDKRGHDGSGYAFTAPNAYSVLLPCISDACPSSGFLKYMHHFGLEPISKPAEHWVLQASLTHPISGALFSFVSVLDASALASDDLVGTGLAGATIGSDDPACLSGLSRSKFPVSAHPATTTARSAANGQFILLPLVPR